MVLHATFSFLIESSSKLLVTSTGIKAWKSSISGLWFPWPIYMFLEMRFDLGTLDSGEGSLPFGLLVLLDKSNLKIRQGQSSSPNFPAASNRHSMMPANHTAARCLTFDFSAFWRICWKYSRTLATAPSLTPCLMNSLRENIYSCMPD